MPAELRRGKHRGVGRLIFWFGAVLMMIAVMRSISVTETDPTDPVDEVDDQVAIRTIQVKTVDVHPANPNQREAERGEFDLAAGESISLAIEDLPKDRPLTLDLALPAVLPSADPLPARIVAMDGTAKLKLPDAVVASDRDRVQVEIESGWLAPGRYSIEIETSETAQLALRRYLLEVH